MSLHGDPPGWVEPLLKRLMQLLPLPQDWDSYGGLPVAPANVWAAWHVLTRLMREQLPLPALVPTRRGGVQIEWHRRGIDLEIEVLAAGRLLVSFEDAHSGESWEREWLDDLAGLLPHLARLETPVDTTANARSAP